MDKVLLARKLYQERVSTLVGDHEVNEDVVAEMWDSKVSPHDAAKAIKDEGGYHAPAWLDRYLNRK